jgi:ureidoglycolate hydrolase
MNRIAVAERTSEAFAPFGEVGAPRVGVGQAPLDVPLDLSRGVPRCQIMRLTQRGLVVEVMARHDRVTQCLGAVDGELWLIAGSPARTAEPGLADIRASRTLPDRFIKLGPGTWHAGPSFNGPLRDFYNLEMVDTKTADYTVWRLYAPVEFAT